MVSNLWNHGPDRSLLLYVALLSSWLFYYQYVELRFCASLDLLGHSFLFNNTINTWEC